MYITNNIEVNFTRQDKSTMPDQDPSQQYLYELFTDLPRQGPGNSRSTQNAYSLLKKLPEMPIILDIGCGSGAQTLDLARISGGLVVAVDNYQPFLDFLEKRAIEQNLQTHIRTQHGDMFALEFKENSFDIIWAEGSIYKIGLEKGLTEWSKFLRVGGYIVVSDAVWLKANPPEPFKSFILQECPDITNITGCLSRINRSGFECQDYFTLPENAWREDYYKPVKARLEEFKIKYKKNRDAKKVAANMETEIKYYEKYSDYFGYVFFILKKSS